MGLTYDITDRFGVNLQFVYKHTFKEYLTKHFQNSVGIYYNLGNSAPKEEPKEVMDADNDGVEDAYDLCPDVAGKKEFAGCPDTDGDGIPDSLDKCPNEKNAQGGCPVKEVKTADMQGSNANNASTAKEPKTLNTEKTVYFEFNSTLLDNNAKEVLDAVVEMTKNASSVSIHIDGHTDNSGKETFNKTLSSDRANIVKGYLSDNGVPSSSIVTDSFGETKPKADNSSEAGRALNRRAELKIKIAVN
ncbi:OmpA family protein [Gaetbulibacter jejuensis]|uniref:OmpA family protein n=1 Tax=Gaetbulibacter jejuensis TaxID=584607 RepID=UPI00300AC411